MKLSLNQKIAGVLVAVLALFGVGVGTNTVQLGSVTVGNEYHASSTKDHVGNTISDLNVLSSCGGSLGSVVITGANSGTFALYDATSTVTNTEWATTTLAQFPTNAAAGTYTFDIVFYKGLLLDYVTGMATATVTFRPGC